MRGLGGGACLCQGLQAEGCSRSTRSLGVPAPNRLGPTVRQEGDKGPPALAISLHAQPPPHVSHRTKGQNAASRCTRLSVLDLSYCYIQVDNNSQGGDQCAGANTEDKSPGHSLQTDTRACTERSTPFRPVSKTAGDRNRQGRRARRDHAADTIHWSAVLAEAGRGLWPSGTQGCPPPSSTAWAMPTDRKHLTLGTPHLGGSSESEAGRPSSSRGACKCAPRGRWVSAQGLEGGGVSRDHTYVQSATGGLRALGPQTHPA